MPCSRGSSPDPGIKPRLISPALAGRFFITRATWEAPHNKIGKRKQTKHRKKKKQTEDLSSNISTITLNANDLKMPIKESNKLVD